MPQDDSRWATIIDVPDFTLEAPGLPSHPWITPLRRKLSGYWDGEPKMRKVWQASTKLGTQPGGIGLFSAEPVVGVVCEWWQVKISPSDQIYQKAHRVMVDRIDDVVQRVFVRLF
jgi:hypothetical protein